MFKFNFNIDEVDIINKITTLFLDGIMKNNIEIEENSIKRLLKFSYLDTSDNIFSIIDFYTMLVFLNWTLRNVSIRYAGEFEVNYNNQSIIKKLK